MPHDSDRTRVLIIEDDPLMSDLLTTCLSQAGYETFQARDGHDGLDKLRNVRPDVALLDINMPRMDGFDVLRQMDLLGYLPRIPTMVLTARNQTEDVQAAIKLGASDFLTKPFENSKLLARVARLVRSIPGRPVRSSVLWE